MTFYIDSDFSQYKKSLSTSVIIMTDFKNQIINIVKCIKTENLPNFQKYYFE